MDQFKKLFAALSMAQKIGPGRGHPCSRDRRTLVHALAARKQFQAPVQGYGPGRRGAVVAKLKESGVEHRLADNGRSVLVPEDKVDEVRLELAGAGLPKTGRIGYELFDKTNLTLTDFSEHVNYLRAIEGELEKTIKSINEIEDARVHVTFPKDSVFLDSREPAKASVLVRVRPGVHLLPQNVTAIANLVASAVEGLVPDSVSIVDMQGNLLSRHRKPSVDGSDAADNTLEYKDQVEKELTSKVEATLDPLLGEGRFRVGVTADCDFSTSEQTDEVYDPTRSVMSSSQKTEDLSQGGGPGGVPGTPSNLPRSQIKSQAVGPGGSTLSRRTENTSFETSRTVRQVKVPRGVIKKISAALLIDQDVEWQGTGKQRKRVFIPPSAEKLKAIHDVVAGVLGISTDRGDQLIVETLPFEQTRNSEDATAAEMASKSGGPAAKTMLNGLLTGDKKMLMGAGGGLLLLVLLLGLLLRSRKKSAAGVELDERPVILPGKSDNQGTADSSGMSKQVEGAGPTMTEGGPQGSAKELEEGYTAMLLPEMTSETKTLLETLRRSIGRDPDVAANVVRTWMDEQ